MKRTVVVMTVLMFSTLFWTIGCKQPAEESGKLSQEDVAGIKANIEAWVQAGLAGDWDSFFAQFTGDAEWVFLRGAPAVQGLSAMKKINFVKFHLQKETCQNVCFLMAQKYGLILAQQ